jgi:hypothetical protein
MLQIKPTMRKITEETQDNSSAMQVKPLKIEMSSLVKSNPTIRTRDISLFRQNLRRLEIPPMQIAEMGSQQMVIFTTKVDPGIIPTQGDLGVQ